MLREVTRCVMFRLRRAEHRAAAQRRGPVGSGRRRVGGRRHRLVRRQQQPVAGPGARPDALQVGSPPRHAVPPERRAV